eukprot:gb/GEZN01015754.1/.p1 GENE.gb/GEZN01015754.1/~~gb/GEZN01015754.1/.p1  ORF type:complete len:206 (+),score=34.10 gb/GEZN01015754.1/:37-654(+)
MGDHKHSATCGCAAEVRNAAGIESLYAAIDLDKVRCMGAEDDQMGRAVFKPHDKRLSAAKLRSVDGDPEVLLHVVFTCQVKLHSFCIICSGDTAPTKVAMWKNRDDLDLESVGEMKPLQEWGLNDDEEGKLFYMTQLHKFQNVSSLTLYFPNSQGEEQTVIQYVGLRGVTTQNKKGIVKNLVYEARANPKDHQTKDDQNMSSGVS